MVLQRDFQQSPTVEIIRGGHEIVRDLYEDWQNLSEKSDNPYPFCCPEWVSAYFCNNSKATFLILSVRVNGKLVALLPLIERKRRLSYFPASVFRGPSDFDLWPFDILVESEENRNVIERAIWNFFRDFDRWDIIELPNVPKGGMAESIMYLAGDEGYPIHRWEYMHSPYIPLYEFPNANDPMQVVCSKNLKKTIKSILRKLEKEDALKILHTDTADPMVLKALYELEATGWKGEKGDAILRRKKDIELWDRLAQWGQKRRMLCLTGLEIKGQIAGVAVGFTFKNRYYGLKLGWDEQYRSYSLGHLLVYNAIKQCMVKGVSEFNMMGLRSDWKEQWTKRTKAYATCYVFRKGVYGSAIKNMKYEAIARQIERLTCKEGHVENANTILGKRGNIVKEIGRSIFDKIDNIYDRSLKSVDRLIVPAFNSLFNYYARKCPQKFSEKIEKGLGSGLSYFEKQRELSFDAVATFTIIINKSFESRLGRLNEKIRAYAEKYSDPHLRLLDRRYDPNELSGSAVSIDMSALTRVEKPLLKCIYANPDAFDENVLNELEEIDDNGSYGTTHKLLGCVILKKMSGFQSQRLDRMIQSSIESIVEAQKYACAGDIFSERTVLLQWLDCDHLVQPAWIIRIMRAQMRNGGWYWKRSLKPKAHQHPSCLGVTALIQFREKHMRSKTKSSSAKASIMGDAFPLASPAFKFSQKDKYT